MAGPRIAPKAATGFRTAGNSATAVHIGQPCRSLSVFVVLGCGSEAALLRPGTVDQKCSIFVARLRQSGPGGVWKERCVAAATSQ